MRIGTSTVVAQYRDAETFWLNSFTNTFGTTEGADTITVSSSLSSTLVGVNGGSGEDLIYVPHQENSNKVTVDGGGGLDTVYVNSGGIDSQTVVFTTSQDLRFLKVFAGGHAELAENGEIYLELNLDSDSALGLDLASNTALDLKDNNLIIKTKSTDRSAEVQSLINAARSGGMGGPWTGHGITSTSARDVPNGTTTLARVTPTEVLSLGNGEACVFDGVRIVDVDAVLVQYTYYGDADLNGTVNFDDYSRIDNGFNLNRTGWTNGDFDNGGGVPNFDDYSRIDNAFNNQGTVLHSGPGDGGNPNLLVIAQMEHFTQSYMWHFIDWNIDNHGIYYTPEDFFPDGVPW